MYSQSIRNYNQVPHVSWAQECVSVFLPLISVNITEPNKLCPCIISTPWIPGSFLEFVLAEDALVIILRQLTACILWIQCQLPRCMTLCKSLNLSVSMFPHP